MATGDSISQLAIEKRQIGQNYEPVRTMRFFTFGFFIGGPVLRQWYVLLDKIVKPTLKLAAFRKMALDQSLFSPCFQFFFWTTMGVARGESVKEIRQSLSTGYLSVLLNSYKIWPAVQIINFYFVPLQHRVMVVNTVALGWNTYMAWASENQQKQDISD